MTPLASLMDNAGRLTTSGLAVLGAAVGGAVLAGAGVNLLTRALFGKRLPVGLLRLVRVLAGLASGLAAGLLLFSGAGGWGFGTGSGSEGQGTDVIKTAMSPPAVEVPAPMPAHFGVTMLGGARVRGGAFYLLDGERVPRTLESLEDRLVKLVGPGGLMPVLTIRIYEDSVAAGHPAVLDLEAWAVQRAWRVNLEKLPGTLPVAEGDRP